MKTNPLEEYSLHRLGMEGRGGGGIVVIAFLTMVVLGLMTWMVKWIRSIHGGTNDDQQTRKIKEFHFNPIKAKKKKKIKDTPFRFTNTSSSLNQVVLLGPSHSGKTPLLYALRYGHFPITPCVTTLLPTFMSHPDKGINYVEIPGHQFTSLPTSTLLPTASKTFTSTFLASFPFFSSSWSTPSGTSTTTTTTTTPLTPLRKKNNGRSTVGSLPTSMISLTSPLELQPDVLLWVFSFPLTLRPCHALLEYLTVTWMTKSDVTLCPALLIVTVSNATFFSSSSSSSMVHENRKDSEKESQEVWNEAILTYFKNKSTTLASMKKTPHRTSSLTLPNEEDPHAHSLSTWLRDVPNVKVHLDTGEGLQWVKEWIEKQLHIDGSN
ncbi:hypothetical protein HMI54_002639 [Coelomomyces lativittatus]|nr:hypothetical protein HMI54_002639 [Coelomomyces lativittatus]